LVSDYGELQVMRDIVLDEEYAVKGIEPETILDLGANVGIASAWFRARYPAARIVAVEADPDTFAKLEHSLAHDESVTLVNAAVAARSGEVTLFRAQGYSVASSLAQPEGQDVSPVSVRACTIDELCAEHGLERLDLLKLDVEGAEIDALEGLSEPERVGVMIGEVHPLLLDGGPDRFFAQLDAFDVDRLSESVDSIAFVARASRSARAGVPTPRA
jgi:FkbM family methyltransferase